MVTWFKALFVLGGGGGNMTFDVYNSSRHIVVSVRHSGPL